MSLRFPSCSFPAAVAVALLALAAAAPASALSFTNLSVSGDGSNVLVDGTGDKTVAQSSVSVVSSSATSFATRYAAVVGADKDGPPGSTTPSATLNASYTITFEVNADAGQSWSVQLTTSLLGAMTIVSDGKGAASASVGAVTGTSSGAGTLAGSLGLAAPGTLSNQTSATVSLDSGFGPTSSATLSGVGTGAPQAVTLSFTWQMTATTIPQGNSADEAAVRLGMDSGLTSYTADDYPGPGSRTPANDGFFVSANLLSLVPTPVPEPGSLAMMLAGLVGLALFGRRPVRG
jgi:hypothetical protein